VNKTNFEHSLSGKTTPDAVIAPTATPRSPNEGAKNEKMRNLINAENQSVTLANGGGHFSHRF
jgi:hypothetical protein